MNFFGMGIWEVLIILIVALLIGGPGRIVEIATKLGKMARTLKRASFDLTAQVAKELKVEETEQSGPADKKQQQRNSGDGKQEEGKTPP